MNVQSTKGSNRLQSPLSTLLFFTRQPKTYTAAIFDLDGVIVDTAGYHFAAWARLADGLGFTLPPEAGQQIKGATRPQSLEIVLSAGGLQLSEDEKSRLLESTQADYRRYIQTLGPPNLLPGVLVYLQTLKRAGVAIGLGSSSRSAAIILAQLGLLEYFDTLVTGSQITFPKPHPEVFLTAAHNLGHRPQSCVVFEDSQAGLTAAKAAGMLAIGVGAAADLPQADLVIPGFAIE